MQIPYPVIVEGRYDKLRLESVIEGQILTTDGFGIFNKKEKRMLFLALAKKTPIILLTDSDGAGRLIRSHISSVVPKDRLIHLYIPSVKGKEKRKREPSAEGTLGVEGMDRSFLHDLLAPYASEALTQRRLLENPLCKTDFYNDGLTGGANSRERRNALAQRLDLPPDMTPNALLSALRVLCSYEEYCTLVGRNGVLHADEKES